jgi:hypothetical protein
MCLLCTEIQKPQVTNSELAKMWRELKVDIDHVPVVHNELYKAGRIDDVVIELQKLMDGELPDSDKQLPETD